MSECNYFKVQTTITKNFQKDLGGAGAPLRPPLAPSVTAAYLINLGPLVPIEFRLPKKVWSGKEVKFSHLKVFGCISYVHIDFNTHSKLDAKSKIRFFISYGDEKFGYRFSNEQNRKIIISRNVIFNEHVMYKDRSTVVLDVTKIDQKKFEF